MLLSPLYLDRLTLRQEVRNSGKSFFIFSTLWGVPLFVMFCKVFLTCSIGCVLILQPSW